MEQSIESNFFKKFKAIASTVYTSPIFQIFFIKKKILRKSSKPGHGNLVLITSTVQVELSKLNFNFDDVRTFFLQALRDCRQITFVMLIGFRPISKNIKHPLFLMDNIMMYRIYIYKLTKNFYIVFQVWKALLIYIKKFVKYSHQIFYFLLFVSFYISRCFSQVFRASFNII